MLIVSKLRVSAYVQLDLYLLSQKWKELVEKARSKQLQPHEYNSGLIYVILFMVYVVYVLNVSFLK